jgi:hypothetical protein
MSRSPLGARRLLAITLAALIALPPAALAQAPAKPAPAKPIPVAVSDQKVELLFVQNATGIQYDSGHEEARAAQGNAQRGPDHPGAVPEGVAAGA